MSRPSRRPVLLFAVLGLAIAGCEPAAPGPSGTAVIATSADADVLIPALSTTSPGFAVGEQLFLKLAEMGPELNTTGDAGFIPELAESWTFEDSLTLAFDLHPDARWHDGRPVTAEDVVFSFELYRDSAAGIGAGPLLGSITSVEARGQRTVVFRFARAYAEQFYDATHHLWILPRHLLDTIPPERLRQHPLARAPVGAGPYRFVRWAQGEAIELAADTGFFRGPPGIARLIWRVTPDFGAAISQVVAGESDILEAVVGPENVARVREAANVRLVDYPSNVYVYVGFNLRAPGAPARPHALFGDRELRRALSLATDRRVLIDAVLEGRGQVPRGPTTPMVWIWDGAPSQPAHDSAAAAAALDRLGWRDADGDGIRERNGRPLSFDLLVPASSAIRQRAAVILQDQWRRLGVAVNLVELEFNTFVTRAGAGRFDAFMGALGIDPAPSGIRQLWTREGIGGSNYGRYASPAFDSLVARAVRTSEREQARALWHEALRTINDDAPAVWLFTPSLGAAVATRLHAVTIRPDLWSAFLWEWQVADTR